MAPSKHHDPNLLYPPPAGNSGLGPEGLGGLEPGGRPVDPDISQQSLVSIPTATVPASSATARPNEKEGTSARETRTLDTIDMT